MRKAGAPREADDFEDFDDCERARLAQTVAALRAAGQRVVLANGCFDVLHVGHVRYLTAARACGDVLVVAINTDRAVRQAKGPGRPMVPLEERLELIGALGVVDHVLAFDEPTLDATLRALRPDVHAKGTDYTIDSVPEAPTDRELGIEIAICGDPKDHDSSRIIQRAQGMAHYGK